MTEYYSLRRLSPYLGVVQVIDAGNACAYSTTGKKWQVRSVNAYGRYRLTGIWDDYENDTQTAGPGDIHAALRHHPEIPFPMRDHFELWLLRKETRQPLALLKTRRWEREITKVEDPSWFPFMLENNSFVAECLKPMEAARHPAAHPLRHRDVLERLVNGAARPLPAAQWFERRADGSGIGHGGMRLDAEMIGRELPRAAFPELLVDEHWDAPQDARLIEEYHDWNAAQLLAHQPLSRATRSRLERAACRQPQKLLDTYAMIPEVLDEEAMKVALVQARIQCSLG